MKNDYCKLSREQIHALPERFKGFLLSPFQFNLRNEFVAVPEDTFQEMINIIAEYAGQATNAAAPDSRAAQPAPIPGQTGNTMTTPICERKTNDIMQRDGYQKTGYVLMGDDPAARICVSDQGAVSWFTRDQWNWLMHNRDHIEFTWPKPIEPPAGNALTEDAKDAARFRQAIEREDSAELLYAATLNHAPDADMIRREFDASHIKAGQAGKEGS